MRQNTNLKSCVLESAAECRVGGVLWCQNMSFGKDVKKVAISPHLK